MISAVISTAGGTILLILGWLLGGRQKANAELKKTNADATITIQSMYQTFALQYESQYNAVMLEVSALRKEVIELNFRNGIITEASESWEQKFNDLQKEHDALKKAFENYKKTQ